jgi:hypothetical protein
MARVIINAQEKIQLNGTTLSDFRATYPGCYLVRVEDEVEIRITSYTLDPNKLYKLCGIASDTQLLANSGKFSIAVVNYYNVIEFCTLTDNYCFLFVKVRLYQTELCSSRGP